MWFKTQLKEDKAVTDCEKCKEACEEFKKLFKDVYDLTFVNTFMTGPNEDEEWGIQAYGNKNAPMGKNHKEFMGYPVLLTIERPQKTSHWHLMNIANKELAFLQAILSNVSYTPNKEFNDALAGIQELVNTHQVLDKADLLNANPFGDNNGFKIQDIKAFNEFVAQLTSINEEIILDEGQNS